MSDKIKVGIIGCGGIANAKHLPALSHQKNRVDIVAFCDLIPERAKKPLKNTVRKMRTSILITANC